MGNSVFSKVYIETSLSPEGKRDANYAKGFDQKRPSVRLPSY